MPPHCAPTSNIWVLPKAGESPCLSLLKRTIQVLPDGTRAPSPSPPWVPTDITCFRG